MRCRRLLIDCYGSLDPESMLMKMSKLRAKKPGLLRISALNWVQNDGLQHVSDTWYGTTLPDRGCSRNCYFPFHIVIYPNNEN
jgi:hypothetical protein